MGLNELAGRAGVSAAVLSLIERGGGNPSIGTLQKIADGLGVPLFDLLGDALGSDAPEPVVRRAERRERVLGAGWHITLLTRSMNGPVALYLVRLDAGGTSGMVETRGFAVVTVQRGTVEFLTDAGATLLEEGDTLSYDGRIRHEIRAGGTAPAELMLVDVPASRVTERAP